MTFRRKISAKDVVAKKQSKAAKKAVIRAARKSIEDQDIMLRRAHAK